MPQLDGLDHLVLTVADLTATRQFYETVLGMTAEPFTVADGSTRFALMFGQQKINLHPAHGPFEPHAKRPMPGTADLCFVSRTPLSEWMAHLETCRVPLLDGPVPRTGARGPITSLYLRDPDGNLIEISTYD